MDEEKPGTEVAPHVLDVTDLKALAHPLRVQLWDALVAGPATASQLAERLGESSGSTSYHLRQLARRGFVEEVAGRGTGRERWWRATPRQTRIRSSLNDTPAGRAALEIFGDEWLRLRFRAAAEFQARKRAGLEEWATSAVETTSVLYLTRDELDAFVADQAALADRMVRLAGDRDEKNAPEGARTVEVQFRAFPRTPDTDRPTEEDQ